MHAVLKRYRPCKTVVGGHGAGGQAGLHRAVVAHFEKRLGYAVYGGIPAVVFLVCVETGVCKAFRNAEYFFLAAFVTAVGAAGGKAQQHDKRKRERDYSLFHFFTLSFQIILRLLSESRGRMHN